MLKPCAFVAEICNCLRTAAEDEERVDGGHASAVDSARQLERRDVTTLARDRRHCASQRRTAQRPLQRQPLHAGERDAEKRAQSPAQAQAAEPGEEDASPVAQLAAVKLERKHGERDVIAPS